MNYYKLNKKTLEYKKTTLIQIIGKIVLIVLITIFIMWLIIPPIVFNQEKTISDEVKLKNDTILQLRNYKYVKSNLMMNCQDLIKDEKDAIRLKKLYFQAK